MKNLLLFIYFPVLLLMLACSPKVSTQLASSEKPEALDYDKEVYVFNSGDNLPPVIRELGMLKVGDLSRDCNYETVIAVAKEEARKAGGNTLLITSHELPDFWNNCHRIAAKVLLVNTDSLVAAEQDFANTAVPKIYRPIYNPFHLALSVGGGYRIAAALPGASSSDKDYINGLRSGVTAGADAYRYFNNYLGLGAKVWTNWVSNSDYGMNEDIMTFFVGPVFAVRFLSASKKNAFNMTVALGYLVYRDVVSNGFQIGTISANTFGAVLDYGYDIGLSQHVAIGFRLSLLAGGFSKVTITGGRFSRTETLPGYESLARVDLTVGIRFNP